jgi:acetyl esterase/lipase
MNIPVLRPLLFTITSALLALRAVAADPPNYHPTLADVRYGKYDRDVLDFFRADTKQPAPVLIYYHGGGWLGGDKKSFNPEPILRRGISVVAANYRFTQGTPDAAPYPAPMVDSARALQFVRSKAAEWYIDPNRVALTGSSAGAVICMWIAYRADMAKPGSADLIERFSTRVTCILPQAGPTLLDPKFILQRIGGPPEMNPALLALYHARDGAELETPEKQKLIADASPINFVSKDNPPTFMQYPFSNGPLPLPADTSGNVIIHHGQFGVMLKEKLDAAGVENVLQVNGDGSDAQAMWKFLIKHLKPESAGGGK